MKVAIVGAGIHGASAALSLALRGHSVTIYEQFPLGEGLTPHPFGSSHGRSRIIRKAYPDPFYTEIMATGYDLWDRLQLLAGKPHFVHHTGLLYYGDAQSATLAAVRVGLEANQVPMEIWRATDSPTLKLKPHEIGLFTPEAGWVHADLAVAATLRVAMAHGATLRNERVEDLAELEAQFDAVLIAAGAWIREFVPLDVEVAVQTVAYVRADYHGPVWIEDGADFLYGFPTAPGESTAKAGVHLRGQPWHRTEPRPGPDQESIAQIQAWFVERVGVENPEIDEVVTCLYTNTPDEDFRVGRIGEKSIFVSACSGHGFKFGPWMGERLAEALEGDGCPEFDRFAWPPR